MQCAAHDPLYDVHPLTGVSIEVFYADRALETFGRCGAGWFWWARQTRLFARGSVDWSVCYGLRSVPARDETFVARPLACARQSPTYNVNADTVRTRVF